MVSSHRLTRRLSAPIVFTISQVFHRCGYLTAHPTGTTPPRIFAQSLPGYTLIFFPGCTASPQMRERESSGKDSSFPSSHYTHNNYSHSFSDSFSLLNIKDHESRAHSPGNHLISCKDHVE